MNTQQHIDQTIDVRNEADLETAFNKFIKKWCGKWYSHLIDSDENDGQYIRDKIATEPVKQLEWMLGEIEKMKSGKQRFGENGKRIKDIVDKGGSIIDAVLFQQIYDDALDDVIAKVQAKLQEYKV